MGGTVPGVISVRVGKVDEEGVVRAGFPASGVTGEGDGSLAAVQQFSRSAKSVKSEIKIW